MVDLYPVCFGTNCEGSTIPSPFLQPELLCPCGSGSGSVCAMSVPYHSSDMEVARSVLQNNLKGCFVPIVVSHYSSRMFLLMGIVHLAFIGRKVLMPASGDDYAGLASLGRLFLLFTLNPTSVPYFSIHFDGLFSSGFYTSRR